ncbi:amyloid-beta A4 precursor protein-binding family A member 2 isoform X2 [Stegostoma tigrinum]|uniref:amyloid-beta A4 precursor protein-binding family A member 2 isoform X2 n=1 Tax=Stegostoma tigrinum TaxID=3053191 RepID=UPI00286FCFE5|nr:amyloid-beta A4 precursor protein-binding family A member 2 isoform X2 [Stegostoma tigrinum]
MITDRSAPGGTTNQSQIKSLSQDWNVKIGDCNRLELVMMASSLEEPSVRPCFTSSHYQADPKHQTSEDWQEDGKESHPVSLDLDLGDNLGDGDSSSDYVNNTSEEEEDYDEGLPEEEEEEEGVTYYIRYCPEEDSYLEDMGCTGGGYGTQTVTAAETDDCQEAIEKSWAQSNRICQAMAKESEHPGCDRAAHLEELDCIVAQAEMNVEGNGSNGGTSCDYSHAEHIAQCPQTLQSHSSKLKMDTEDMEEDIDQIVAEIKMSMSMNGLNNVGEQNLEVAAKGNLDRNLASCHGGRETQPRFCKASASNEKIDEEKPELTTPEEHQQWSPGQATSDTEQPRKQQRCDLNGPDNNNYLSEQTRKPSAFPNFVDGPCEPEDLIDGIIFAANYLGSTQLLSERNPSKNIRMMQAQEAVGRIKRVQKTSKTKKKGGSDGDSQPMTEVDLFISTQRIKVLNADSQEPMMDHALRTISYIADIGNIVVLMARRRVPRAASQDCIESTPGSQEAKKQYKMVCHVFESEDAQLIAQSIGQAFSVAYQEFLRANGINPEDLSQKEYSDIINTQEMYNDDLVHFSNSANCKELHVDKLKGEIFGVVIVESGWGSILPTVILANMMNGGAAARSGKLSIGDQIMSVNGTSLVGLPLTTCQGIIKGLKNQVQVKLNIVSCPPVTTVLIKRPDLKYQLGFSVQNGIICSLMRGGIAERGGVRVGHRIIEINGQSVVATAHEKIVQALSNSVGEIHMKTMPAAMFRLLTGQETPLYI